MKNKNEGVKRGFSILKTVVSTSLKMGFEKLNSKAREGDDIFSKSALRFVEGLDELKGVSMKLGQILSMLDESILPRGWKTQLAKLQQNASVLPWLEIKPILLAEYGTLDHFRSIEEDAAHAASIAQVHRAVLRSGEAVAVKVRYPNIEKYINDDIKNMKRVLKLMRIFPNLDNYDHVIQAVHQMFLKEVDLLIEKDNYIFYRKEMADIENVIVPKVFEDLCTSRVLVTEWIDGLSVSKWTEEHNADFDNLKDKNSKISQILLKVVLYEIFVMKFIQSDPNPGNFIVTKDEKVALIDFGAAFRLSQDLVLNYYHLHQAALRNDGEKILECGAKMGFILASDSEKTKDLFCEIILKSFAPFLAQNFDWYEFKVSKTLQESSFEFGKLTHYRAPKGEILFLNRRLSGNLLLLESIRGVSSPREVAEEIFQMWAG